MILREGIRLSVFGDVRRELESELLTAERQLEHWSRTTEELKEQLRAVDHIAQWANKLPGKVVARLNGSDIGDHPAAAVLPVAARTPPSPRASSELTAKVANILASATPKTVKEITAEVRGVSQVAVYNALRWLEFDGTVTRTVDHSSKAHRWSAIQVNRNNGSSAGFEMRVI
jgi:DNA-binding HxlR family transcriptional regulator